MKYFLVLFFLVGSFLSPAQAASRYKLDEDYTHLGFKVRNLGISSVPGQFKKFHGSCLYDEKTKTLSEIKVTIDANSIDTNQPAHNKHLRSADFFEVKKYGKITFESKKVENSGGKPSKIHGVITIRGVSQDLTLDITEWGGTGEDPWGNQRLAFVSSATIDRRKFGLTWNKGVKKAAGLFVSNEVKLVIEAQGIKQ